MNWTGGALPRSRSGNAKATLAATQKKHFAKIRGKLLNGPRSSPDLDFSIFPHAKDHNRSLTKGSHNSSRREAGNNVQADCDDKNNVTRVSGQLSWTGSQKAGHIADASCSSRDVVAGNRHRSQSFGQSTSAAYAKPEKSIHRSDAIYQGGIEKHPRKTAEEVVADQSFEARRQELLRRQDWVGLANTKPAKIQFTNVKDRELIGKRRRLDDTDTEDRHRQRTKRKAFHYRVQKSPDVENISVRIGPHDHTEHPHNTGVPCQERNSSGTSEEMLFDDDYVRPTSTESLMPNNLRILQEPNRSSSVSLRRPPTGRTETSGSLQNSWAGFSPWSNSTRQTAKGGNASENGEAGGSEMSIDPRERQKRMNLGSPVGAHREQEPWAGVPGLPLLFENSMQTAIEISSDSSSEGYSHSLSDPRDPFEEASPTRRARSKTRECEDSQQHNHNVIGKSTILKSTLAPVRFRNPIEPGEKLSREPPIRDKLQSSPPDTAESRSASINLTQSPEPSGALPAASEVQKRSASSTKIQGFIQSPRMALATDIPSLIDEELVWRNFVFGDSDENDNTEQEGVLRELKSLSNGSSLLTDSSEDLGQSSLSVQASSAAPPTLKQPLRSTGPGSESRHPEEAISIALTPSEVTSPSSEIEVSLPASGEKRQNHAQSSLVAHASTPSSTIRPNPRVTSPSSDELAATPRQPTFFFKKPLRYAGNPLDAPAIVRLGQRQKGTRGKGHYAALAGSGTKVENDGELDEIVDG